MSFSTSTQLLIMVLGQWHQSILVDWAGQWPRSDHQYALKNVWLRMSPLGSSPEVSLEGLSHIGLQVADQVTNPIVLIDRSMTDYTPTTRRAVMTQGTMKVVGSYLDCSKLSAAVYTVL